MATNPLLFFKSDLTLFLKNISKKENKNNDVYVIIKLYKITPFLPCFKWLRNKLSINYSMIRFIIFLWS